MFYYEVNFYDEDENKTVFETGLVGANTYNAAAKRVIKYYGEVYDMKLTRVEDVLYSGELSDFFEKPKED